MNRETVDFNAHWLFCPEDRKQYARQRCSERGFEPVSLPHANVELPYHNFADAEYQFISWYRKRFSLPAEWKDRRVFLDFGGVMMAATVHINGTRAASHKGGYVPFSVDVTPHARFGRSRPNVVAVRVDSRERRDVPPCGGHIDYLTFGGIYRDVRMRAVSPFFIEDVCLRPGDVLSRTKRLDAIVTLRNLSGARRSGKVTVELLGPDGKRIASSGPVQAAVARGGTATADLAIEGLEGVELWGLDNPVLYRARVTLKEGRRSLDRTEERFGFRRAVFTAGGPFELNGRPVKLRGLNRHQTYPYVGGAAPARLQRRDAEVLKHELGVNVVRTSHYPQSPHFLDRCDEIGLLVFEEIPGWQHVGDGAWKKVSLGDLRSMIVRDRNHPSVVLWGVRINESADDHEFYAESNRVAHELDPTRQTGGVRCFKRSELLEDVYTMNDFIHSGGKARIRAPRRVTGLRRKVPYLVTEFGGHMYSTKSYDQQERVVEHALRHARVQDAAAGRADVAGAIGWCAFDYNTHTEFGSGDRICYHGVCDIFRLPKFAAWFYESQIDPGTRPVLRVASRWKLGERSQTGVEPLVIFTNCDSVLLHVGSRRLGVYRPDRKQFPHLEHPPVICTGLGGVGWEAPWADLRAVGLIGGKPAAEQRIAADGVPAQLLLQADHDELVADGADMTRIGFMVADRYGNALPYSAQAVRLTVRGPATLVGENPFALVGGVGAVYLRAGARPGSALVAAEVQRLPRASATVRLRAARG
jgi:beta-galactosidase